jgi:hypothetical protein
VAILFLALNLLQNHVFLHDQAVKQSIPREAIDWPLPESTRRLRSNNGKNNRGPISLTIPEGKAVALQAARLSDAEDSKIQRAHYGGKGDMPHLGTLYVISTQYCMNI